MREYANPPCREIKLSAEPISRTLEPNCMASGCKASGEAAEGVGTEIECDTQCEDKHLQDSRSDPRVGNRLDGSLHG